MSDKHTSGRGYVLTWIGLLVLTALSYLASLVDVGPWDMTVALGIATVKAILVALIFMHLLEGHFTDRMVLLLSLAFVIILTALMIGDIATRHTFPAIQEKPVLPVFEEARAPGH